MRRRGLVPEFRQGLDQDNWVYLDAHRGRERGILVPVTIEGVTPPFASPPLRTRDLTHWNGASREGAEDFPERRKRGARPHAARGDGFAAAAAAASAPRRGRR